MPLQSSKIAKTRHHSGNDRISYEIRFPLKFWKQFWTIFTFVYYKRAKTVKIFAPFGENWEYWWYRIVMQSWHCDGIILALWRYSRVFSWYYGGINLKHAACSLIVIMTYQYQWKILWQCLTYHHWTVNTHWNLVTLQWNCELIK